MNITNQKNMTRAVVSIIIALILIVIYLAYQNNEYREVAEKNDGNATKFFGGSNDSNDSYKAPNNPVNVQKTATGKSEVTSKTVTNTSAGTAATSGNASGPNLTAVQTMIGNSIIRVPQTGTDVVLTRGSADYQNAQKAIAGHIESGPIIGWVWNDDGYDVFTDLTITKTGSATVEHYVALFYVPFNSAYAQYKSAIPVGDRLIVRSISAKQDNSVRMVAPAPYMYSALGYLLTINYLDRANGVALTSAPTEPKTITVHVLRHLISR